MLIFCRSRGLVLLHCCGWWLPCQADGVGLLCRAEGLAGVTGRLCTQHSPLLLLILRSSDARQVPLLGASALLCIVEGSCLAGRSTTLPLNAYPEPLTLNTRNVIHVPVG